MNRVDWSLIVIQGRYEVAMRDYKKGKFLLESRPGQLLPIASKDGQSTASDQQQQKRILEKVWNSAEKAMGEMRNVLQSQLQNPSRTIEEQEKTIEYVYSPFPPAAHSGLSKDFYLNFRARMILSGPSLIVNTNTSWIR